MVQVDQVKPSPGPASCQKQDLQPCYSIGGRKINTLQRAYPIAVQWVFLDLQWRTGYCWRTKMEPRSETHCTTGETRINTDTPSPSSASLLQATHTSTITPLQINTNTQCVSHTVAYWRPTHAQISLYTTPKKQISQNRVLLELFRSAPSSEQNWLKVKGRND